MTGQRRQAWWISAGVLWLSLVVVGLAQLMNYDNKPGLAASAPRAWPSETSLTHDAEGPTIVMLAHPRCDCTRASVAELAELMARATHRPRAFVLFVELGSDVKTADDPALARAAAAIPGVTVVSDPKGIEARRFGVSTSGQVLVYGASGGLLYSGGTTGSRGKTGDNAGRAAILAAISSGSFQGSAPVFGCALFSPADLAEEPAHVHAVKR